MVTLFNLVDDIFIEGHSNVDMHCRFSAKLFSNSRKSQFRPKISQRAHTNHATYDITQLPTLKFNSIYNFRVI